VRPRRRARVCPPWQPERSFVWRNRRTEQPHPCSTPRHTEQRKSRFCPAPIAGSLRFPTVREPVLRFRCSGQFSRFPNSSFFGIVKILTIHRFKAFESSVACKPNWLAATARNHPYLIVRPGMEVDPTAIVRPTRHIRAIHIRGELARFASCDSDNPNVRPGVWRTEIKGDPLSIGRPPRRSREPVQKRQPPQAGAVAHSDPDIGGTGALRVKRNPLAVGGEVRRIVGPCG
jgi:hypothetical protein